eukprot:scaffold625_cov420-Prasinococcus_capsulatus_cf.AAC.7
MARLRGNEFCEGSSVWTQGCLDAAGSERLPQLHTYSPVVVLAGFLSDPVDGLTCQCFRCWPAGTLQGLRGSIERSWADSGRMVCMGAD